ncbi:hypothetical protein [Sphingomonas sp. LaA6.9]|uniref:hypothetical protein n=1 Tax=Sphingomonas sp. LaA6.9 TaxID=2919914 RepID=UPI001F4FFEB4|nr:hypothetical protein [Sphingomonas sp. LaA6.9]MCJ8158174.1 hypothetical protein [Sphingomonas sp. LaA6.9]
MKLTATAIDAQAFADAAAELLTQGGDARIIREPATGLNQYFSQSRPSSVIAYASSTANDISAPAFDHVCRRIAEIAPDLTLSPAGYTEALEGLRGRIRDSYSLADDVEIVFSPSGTDLEYVGLALAKEKAPGGIRNILLGADEVGSGCIYSARGQYFAKQTARDIAVAPGEPVGGRIPEKIELTNVPVRDDLGAAWRPESVAEEVDRQVIEARGADRHTVVHVVHGSKTGLVLPSLEHIDALKAKHGDAVSFIVDACQARITTQAIHDYLARGCTVLLTGSKFMGGPPFSGFALVPRAAVEAAALMPIAFCKIFRRGEWPDNWPDVDLLPRESNLGLLLRLEASVFELERFQALSIERVERVVLAFHAAVRKAMVERLGGRRIAPYAPGERAEGDAHPIEMRTLSTIDISRMPGQPDFDDARRIHRALVDHGVRLGQPVKCVRLPDGRWGGTLRVGLSMPQVTAFDALDDAALEAQFERDMTAVAEALEKVVTA